MSIGSTFKTDKQFFCNIENFSADVCKSLRTKSLQAWKSSVSLSSHTSPLMSLLWLLGLSSLSFSHWCERSRKAWLQFLQTGALDKMGLDVPGRSPLDVEVQPEADFLSLTLGTWWSSLGERGWHARQTHGKAPQIHRWLSDLLVARVSFWKAASAPGVTGEWRSALGEAEE